MSVALTQAAQRRLVILTAFLAGSLTSAEAAAELGLSTRQVRRLASAFLRHGPAGLVHGNRGRRSARRTSDAVRARLVELATTTYAGVSQNRLRELLAQRERMAVSRSTVRRILSAAGVKSNHRGRPRRLPAGMMPVMFDLSHRRVELLDLHGADYREPFFHQVVERWRREQPERWSLELDLEAFVAATRLEPGRQPDGFIFHVGRCGSTLLANMLSSSDEHLVIKESTAVNTLMNGLINAGDEERRREREALLQAALPFMFRPSRGTEQRLLFKLTSWNVRLAAALLRLFPSTPAAFLYRSGSQTVASMLAEPSGWQNLQGRPRPIQARYFPSLAEVPADSPLSTTAFYAHAWRSAVETALALPEERLLVIEYGDLVARPEAMLASLMAHFGLPFKPESLALMCRAMSVYSKDPSGQSGFEPTGAHRRPALDPDQEAEVLAIIGDLPARLGSRHGPRSGEL